MHKMHQKIICLPLNTSWSLSSDLTSSSQGLDSSLGFSCYGTKEMGKNNNEPVVWQCHPCVNSLWSSQPALQCTTQTAWHYRQREMWVVYTLGWVKTRKVVIFSYLGLFKHTVHCPQYLAYEKSGSTWVFFFFFLSISACRELYDKLQLPYPFGPHIT